MGLRDRPVLIMVALAALAGLATACTSSEQGTPTAGGTPTSTAPPVTGSSTPSTPPTSGSIPNPVDLSSVNACKLFTSAVSAVAETTGTPNKASVPRLPKASGCFQFNESKNVGLMLAVSSDINVNDFQMSMGTQPQSFTVAGYPGVVIAPLVPKTVCFAGVGMGDHQLLYLQYALANPGAQPQVSQDDLCGKLQPIAQQVVAQLAQ